MRGPLPVAVILAVFFGALPAAAQSNPSPAAAQQNPSQADVFIGGSYWMERRSVRGIVASVAVHPTGGLSAVLEIGHFNMGNNRAGSLNRCDCGTLLLGGVRVPLAIGGSRPFVQLLMGRAPVAGMAFLLGGGIDWPTTRRTRFRVEADASLGADKAPSITGYRVSAGIVFGL